MSYQLLTNRAAPCFTKGRGGNRIKYIVIHHWDDPAKKPSFEGVVNWFGSGRGNNSAHYVVEAGKAARMVAETDTAWHAGNWAYNQQSIGIECNPRNTEADRRTIGELIDDIQRRHGKLTIIGHKDCSSTACPGSYYPPAKVLAPYIGKGSTLTPTPQPTVPSSDVDALARAVIRGDYGNGAERKRRLGSKYATVQARVNQILAGGSTAKPTPAPDIEALANAVIRGDYGNGEERKRRLGALYAQVQARVNQKLGY